MKSCRPPLFRNRQFEPEVIVTCVRWYLRFSLSLRDLEELMAERGLSVDHTTIWRWTQKYGPEVYRLLGGEVKRKSSTWHIDETFVRIAGRWMYLFRAVDSNGQTVDFYLSDTRDRAAAKVFLKRALANPDNRPLTSWPETVCATIQLPFASCAVKVTYLDIAGNAHAAPAITGSSPTIAKLNGVCGRCKDLGRQRQRGG